ncbi:hypothetical protein DYB32_006620 [Aphanomyces invadans]|uniref:C3H1-type domain-containing protein n=1 Tax=Aphanomyces invadans TaxID=157072 RepID=A0A3R6ZMW6_9STRA|nr:hypothetical protein DYB32_006620 [Aphanomyces invadans]
MTDHRRCRAAAIAVVVAATAQAQLVTTMTTPPPPPSEGNGLRPGVVVGLVVGVVVVGAILVYGGIYFLKQHTLRGAAALSTDKVVTTNDAQAYFGPARQSDDFDVYFGKQPSMVTNMASHPCVKLGSSRATAATVAVDINVPTKPASSRALPPTTVHHVKLDAVMSPQHSSVADDAPSDMVTAMRSYRSMIQQQTMGNLWTTSDVLAEIKDSKSRRFVARLPMELKTRDPSEKDMDAVVAFSRLTGDFSFLSLTDLRVMALTYMFERELHGTDHIRKTPKVAETKVTGPKVPASKVRCRYIQSPGGCRNGSTCPFSHNLKDNAIVNAEPLPAIELPCRYFNSDSGCTLGNACRFLHVLVDSDTTTAPSFDARPEKTMPSTVPEDDDASIAKASPEDVVAPRRIHATVKSRILSAGFGASTNAGADGDDGKNWINSTNMAEFAQSPFGSGKLTHAIDASIQVGCITTDYSMQVLKSAFGEHVAHDLGVKAEKQTAITVGYGRMNPNAQKGRERRGKKKRSAN